MKNLITGLVILTLLSTLTSCTKVIYTPQQRMAEYTTKAIVVNGFGLPTQKRVGEGIEEWIYDYGTVNTATGFRNTNASVNGGYNSAYGNSSTLTVSQFSSYNRYLKFTFDDKGNVLKWESQGVDLAIRQKSTGKTILYVLLCVAIGVGVGIAASSSAGN